MVQVATPTMTENSIREQVIPNADGSSTVLQQRKQAERQVKTLAPQLDFASVNFCPGEQIKLINKLQLLPGISYNVEKLEYRTIKNTKCLITTFYEFWCRRVTDHDNFLSKIEMNILNKWTKILNSIVGTDNAKYVVTVRCAMENEETFNDKSDVTMKFVFIKTILKKHKKTCDDERMNNINVEEPCLEQEEVRKIIRLWAQSEAKATFEIHRRNLLWNESNTWKPLLKHQTV